MPAESQAQQRYMAIAEHHPEKLRGKKPNMTHQQLHDFASTPRKGLPEHSDLAAAPRGIETLFPPHRKKGPR